MNSDTFRMIEGKVPLLRGESEHNWIRVMLKGCGICGEHVGFECINCRRCVDWELDTPLYEMILSIFPEEDIDD